jgi:hypothetical protein
LPGGGELQATKPEPAKAMDENQLVQELATHLDVKASKGKTLEAAVVDALGAKYGVKIPTTTTGTGTGQGTVGSVRHNIASWFSTAFNAVGTALVPGALKGADAANAQSVEEQRAAALKIKSPKLRELALKKIDQNDKQGITDEGTAPQTAEPVDEQSKKALNDMLAEVGEKLGVGATDLGQTGLANIASAEKLATQTPATPGSAATTQTAGDAYQSFVKQLADTKTATAFAAAQVPALEAAGLLDKNAAGAKQANGTVYTNDQIATAYQSVLQQQVTQNQTEQQALEALASTTGVASGPTSEMQAYVQGVAQEFGVGLTTQQITEIANTYGANATTADDPTSVEDEIKDAVVSLYDPTNPNNPSGVASEMFTDIQSAALDYQIPINAQQIGKMVQQSLQGATVQSIYQVADAAEAAATKQFQEQAQGLYPALATQIAAGNTVQNLVAPYFNVAEAYTGVPAATMMADQQSGGPSKWSAFLQGGTNPSGSTAPGMTQTTGGPQMMTLDQWKTELMQNPTYGFQNTQGAKDMAEQMSSAILNEFGKVNTNGGSSEPFNAYQGSSDLSANTS